MKAIKIGIITFFIVAFLLIIMLLNAGPPKPIVLSEGKKITVLQGTYCWSKFTGSECVDKISPSSIIDNNKIVPFSVSPQSEIKINFKKQPIDEIEVEMEHLGESKKIKVEGNVFSAPIEKGKYIYIISGRWKK
ncbi:hypothetical protein ACIQ7N_15015 [Lysinibacillus sp. NPDC095746]|uniref:hypothetical protein n=1 Tax=Lysinibacillus sp. NPDC095746 TaxID=3364134 RepID=UPI00382908FB